MEIARLKIGKFQFDLPIVQGGMGVRVSGPELVAAVANQGGVGTLSTIGLKDVPFGVRKEKYVDISNNALIAEIDRLKKMTNKPFAVNVMGALTNSNELIQTAVSAGAHIIVYGAGIPRNLPEIVHNKDVALVPIISSARLASMILKVWERYKRVPDAFIIEGTKAGGHLGFKKEQIFDPEYSLDKLLISTLEGIKPFEDRFGIKIPLIVAGGIYTGEDIAKMFELGASGVQMGTRFVTTYECPVSDDFKQAYLHATKEDIVIIESPVGMPGRAINNSFLQKLKVDGFGKTLCPFHCIQSCKKSEAGYCIAERLLSSFRGDVENGLIFAGANAYRVDKIVSVEDLMSELISGIKSY